MDRARSPRGPHLIGHDRAVATPTGIRASKRHWPLLIVVGAYVASAFVVPTLAPVAWHDDWVYARAAETLLQEGRLEVLDVSAPNAVFEALWGAAFGAIFGMSLGVLRASSVVLMALSIPFAYFFAHDLSVSRGTSAVLAAAYAFHPLPYSLSFSFMTDGHFLALSMVAVFLYSRGLRDEPDARYLMAGSAAAMLAYLSRQQGVFLPVAVATFLVLGGHLRLSKKSARLFLAAGAIPTVVAAAHQSWLRLVNGVPSAQGLLMNAIRAASVRDVLDVVSHLFPTAVLIIGFCLMPLGLAIASHIRPLATIRLRAAALFAFGATVFLATALRERTDLVPPAANWLTRGEIGPVAVLKPRDAILTPGASTALTAAAIVSVLALAAHLVARSPLMGRDRRRVLFFLCMLGWMWVSAFSGAFYFRPAGFDRYYLVLLPAAIGLAAVGAHHLPRSRALIGAVVTIAIATISITGTRASLEMQSATWKLARHAVDDLGVRLDQLDAGAAWDGYYMGHTAVPLTSPRHGTTRTPAPAEWWLTGFAPGIDSTFVISGKPIDGWTVVATRDYQGGAGQQTTSVYLLRRPPAP